MKKIYVWSFAARFSHVVMAVALALAYITSDFDRLLYFHAVLGVVFGVAVAMRLVWGFVGTVHSRFCDFKFGGVAEYFLSFFGKKQRFLGHNPASCVAIVLMLLLGVVCAVSGLALYGVDEKSGVFSFLGENYAKFEFVEDLHEFSANMLVCVAVAHVCGALVDKFWHKNDAVDSMVTGFKATGGLSVESDGSWVENSGVIRVRFSAFQRLFCVVWVALILLACGLFFVRENFLLGSRATFESYAKFINSSYVSAKNENVNLENEKNGEIFVKECGSCHMVYPPFLLSARAWEKMMSNLEEHFGDDASIDDEERVEAVRAFLVGASAEKRGEKVAVKMLRGERMWRGIWAGSASGAGGSGGFGSKSSERGRGGFVDSVNLSGVAGGQSGGFTNSSGFTNLGANKQANMGEVAITKNAYWIDEHEGLDERVFTQKAVKSRANCAACHEGIEAGVLQKRLIRFELVE